MQEDAIKIFCLAHGVSFTVLKSKRLIVCDQGQNSHVLSNDFPNSERWFYCCQCQIYWVATREHGDFLRQCPSCASIRHPRYYSCDQCKVTMIDSWGAANRNDVYITPWGVPHPYCPGCRHLPKSISQSHTCTELRGLFTTARTECPFCEGREIAESDDVILRSVDGRAPNAQIAEPEEVRLQPDRQDAVDLVSSPTNEVAILLVEEVINGWNTKKSETVEKSDNNSAPGWLHIKTEDSNLFETEQGSKDIEKELRQRLKADEDHPGAVIKKSEGDTDAEEAGMNAAMEHAWLKVVSITSEATAQIEEEMKARLAAERAKADAETRVHEAEARVNQAEEWIRQTKYDSQIKIEESIARAQAALLAREEMQKKMFEAEVRFREMEAGAHEAEERRQQAEAELQKAQSNLEYLESVLKDVRARIETEVNARLVAEQAAAEAAVETQEAMANATRNEERYKDEIANLKAETEARIQNVKAEIKQAEDNHAIEIAMIKAEADTVGAVASQAEERYIAEIARMEAEVTALTLSGVQTEDNYKTEIIKIRTEAEARAQEDEERARQIEEKHIAEIVRIRAEADAMAAAANQAEERHKSEIAEIKAEARSLAVEASQAEERYKTEIAEVRAEAEAQAHQAKANTRQIEERYQTKIEEAISNTQVAMLAIEEAEKKLIEGEAKYREMEARACNAQERLQEVETRLRQEEVQRALVEEKVEAVKNNAGSRIEMEVRARLEAEQAHADAMANLHKTEKIFHAESARFMTEAEAKFRELESKVYQAQTRSRQVYLVSRLSFSLVEQIFGGSLKMTDEKGKLIIPPDLATDIGLDEPCSKVGESSANGSMDFGDLSLPDKLKAMFEVLAGSRVFGDEAESDNNESSLVPADCVTNENTSRMSAGAIATESVISSER